MSPEQFDLPVVVVREGKIDHKGLMQTRKEEAWLLSVLKEEHYIQLQNFLLATLDRSGKVKVFVYGKEMK